MAESHQTVRIGGRSLRVSSLDKVLYPADGTTKGEVLGYYAAIARVMLPHCRDRPATRKRWPDGVGEDGEAPMRAQARERGPRSATNRGDHAASTSTRQS